MAGKKLCVGIIEKFFNHQKDSNKDALEELLKFLVNLLLGARNILRALPEIDALDERVVEELVRGGLGVKFGRFYPLLLLVVMPVYSGVVLPGEIADLGQLYCNLEWVALRNVQ